MEKKISHANNNLINKTNFFFFMLSLLFTTTTTTNATTIACLDATKCPMLPKTHAEDHQGRVGHGMVFEGKAEVSSDWSRRFLVGPGSSPPLCTSKCGSCTPCRPVHVTVPPGTPVTAEYYPEAWRCKCGNKLNMP